MAYNEQLAQRVREAIANRDTKVEEKKMMGGLTFMVNDKMCVGVVRDELMVRINPVEHELALTQPGCREMDFTGKPMKGFVFVGLDGTGDDESLYYWIDMAMRYNSIAKSSKKKKK